MEYMRQIGTMRGRTICNPDLKIALSPGGNQLKTWNNLDPNQLVALIVKLECPLRHWAGLRSLIVSKCTCWELIQV